MLKHHKPPSEPCQVTLGPRGRFVIPARVRREMKVRPGDRIVLAPQPDGSWRIVSVRTAARALRGLLYHVAPGRSLSQELIAERRIEAAKENLR